MEQGRRRTQDVVRELVPRHPEERDLCDRRERIRRGIERRRHHPVDRRARRDHRLRPRRDGASGRHPLPVRRYRHRRQPDLRADDHRLVEQRIGLDIDRDDRHLPEDDAVRRSAAPDAGQREQRALRQPQLRRRCGCRVRVVAFDDCERRRRYALHPRRARTRHAEELRRLHHELCIPVRFRHQGLRPERNDLLRLPDARCAIDSLAGHDRRAAVHDIDPARRLGPAVQHQPYRQQRRAQMELGRPLRLLDVQPGTRHDGVRARWRRQRHDQRGRRRRHRLQRRCGQRDQQGHTHVRQSQPAAHGRLSRRQRCRHRADLVAE